MHPGASLVSPYQQGKLDALCGLYALINAIRVVHALDHPLSGPACRSLFRTGMKALLSDKHTAAAPYGGLTASQQQKLLKALMRAPVLANRAPLQLRQQRRWPKTEADLELFFRTAIKRGAVILACLHGRMSHHTVITGVRGETVVLCDSSGMSFVYLSSIGLSASGSTGLRLDRLATLSI